MWLYVPSPSVAEAQLSISGSTSLSTSSTVDLATHFLWWKGKPMQRQYWLRAWRKEPWLHALSGLTCSPSLMAIAARTWLQQSLSSCSAESPASLGVLPETERVRKTRETFGRQFGPSWNVTLLLPSSWKTLQDSLFETDSAELPETFQTWVTKWRQSCSPLRMWARAMSGNGCSRWPTPHGLSGTDATGKVGAGGEFAKFATGWNTPGVDSFRSRGGDRKEEAGLDRQARTWSTPRTITGGAESGERKRELGRMDSGGGDLQSQVQSWPTPMVHDSQGGDPKRIGRFGTKAGGRNLADEVLIHQPATWTTPRASDGEHGGPNQVFGGGVPLSSQAFRFSLPDQTMIAGQLSLASSPHLRRRYLLVSRLLRLPRRLNPCFGEWLMGWPQRWTSAGIGCGPSATEFLRYKQLLRTSFYTLLSPTAEGKQEVA